MVISSCFLLFAIVFYCFLLFLFVSSCQKLFAGVDRCYHVPAAWYTTRRQPSPGQLGGSTREIQPHVPRDPPEETALERFCWLARILRICVERRRRESNPQEPWDSVILKITGLASCPTSPHKTRVAAGSRTQLRGLLVRCSRQMSYGHHGTVRGLRPTRVELATYPYEGAALST